ncbi:MAG: 4-hydroxy-tetrahydrodipicolinate synthase [Acholeplasmataceae bacterium]|nr:4-hydroxy-tetrahydrodipicolinate synthase [Acholeplasmataceae bacterium]
MSLFTGSGVAIVTPFKENEVDYNAFQRLIEWHIQEKTDAIIVFGTTGESATLSVEEKKKIVEFAVKIAQKRTQIIAGTGTNDTKISIELSMHAEKAGADGLLLITPYYNKPTQRGLYAHFKAISEHVNIPIILYNVPSRTGVNLLPETVLELSKIRQIKAIKEASADISQIAKVIELVGNDFIVYSGNDDQTLPILALGGKGVISVTANITPRLIHDQVIGYLNGEQKWVQSALQTRELHQVMFIESNPVPAKVSLYLMGFIEKDVRLPLVDLEEKNLVILKNILKKYKLIGDQK